MGLFSNSDRTYHKKPGRSSEGKAIMDVFDAPEGVVKNGVVRYGRYFGYKRPDGSIDIKQLRRERNEKVVVPENIREKIYDDLKDYEGRAPKEYPGPHNVLEPLQYGHVNRGGEKHNEGEATYEGSISEVGLISWTFHKIGKILSGDW